MERASARRRPAGSLSAAVRSAIVVACFALGAAGSSRADAAEPHRERVLTVIVEQFGLQRSTLTDRTNICSLPGIDALKRVELILALDEEFRIRIADADIECLCLVEDIVFYVTNQKRNPRTAICQKLG